MTRARPSLVFGALALIACGRGAPDATSSSTPRPASTSLPATPSLPVAPQSRLELPSSPYAATLSLAGEGAALLTTDAVYHLEAGAVRRVDLGRGELGVLQGRAVVRWNTGRLWRFAENAWAPLSRGSQAPWLLSASQSEVAWAEVGAPPSVSLWTSLGGEPRKLLSVAGGVATMTLHDDQLFFVEELSSSQWRLGAVPLSGGAPRYGKTHTGRAPARLVVTSDVFYYDGPTLSVRRVSTDLLRDESLGRDVVCSPLAVSTDVYCAQPPGAIVAIPLTGGAPRVVAAPLGGLVVGLVATSKEVTWLREAGAGLAVESAPL